MSKPLIFAIIKNCIHSLYSSEYIESSGHVCILEDIGDFTSSSEVADFISEKQFDAVLIIHLYKGGRLLLGAVSSNTNHG